MYYICPKILQVVAKTRPTQEIHQEKNSIIDNKTPKIIAYDKIFLKNTISTTHADSM